MTPHPATEPVTAAPATEALIYRRAKAQDAVEVWDGHSGNPKYAMDGRAKADRAIGWLQAVINSLDEEVSRLREVAAGSEGRPNDQEFPWTAADGHTMWRYAGYTLDTHYPDRCAKCMGVTVPAGSEGRETVLREALEMGLRAHKAWAFNRGVETAKLMELFHARATAALTVTPEVPAALPEARETALRDILQRFVDEFDEFRLRSPSFVTVELARAALSATPEVSVDRETFGEAVGHVLSEHVWYNDGKDRFDQRCVCNLWHGTDWTGWRDHFVSVLRARLSPPTTDGPTE